MSFDESMGRSYGCIASFHTFSWVIVICRRKLYSILVVRVKQGFIITYIGIPFKYFVSLLSQRHPH